MMGTLAWASIDDGRLRLRDRLAMVRDGLRAPLAARRRRDPRLGDAELRELARRPRPAGALVAVAERACRAAGDPWLVEHCVRTFVWADLLGAIDGIDVDRDALLCAALLHDLALTAAHAPPPGACFAIHGARTAIAILREAGAGDDLATRVGDAIALHLNPRVDRRHGSVAHLLQAGAAADVIGLRQRELAAARDEVVGAHPRRGATRALVAAVRAESARSPRTRIAWMCARGFERMIERAPFAD